MYNIALHDFISYDIEVNFLTEQLSFLAMKIANPRNASFLGVMPYFKRMH